VYSQIALFQCSRCNWSQELLHLKVLRRLEQHASRASVTHAWCSDQVRVVLAERVASQQELARERTMIEEVRAGADEDDLVEVPTLEWLDEQIRWRARRVGPAKCLECGSTRITPEQNRPGDPSPTIEHPGCGGSLRAIGLRYAPGEATAVVIDANGHLLD